LDFADYCDFGLDYVVFVIPDWIFGIPVIAYLISLILFIPACILIMLVIADWIPLILMISFGV